MRVAGCVLLCLVALTGSAAAGPSKYTAVAIFYYPWYGTPATDGAYRHWQQNGHVPPGDIAASFYPVRGAYSSSDERVVRAQLREIAQAGIQEIVVSWWGRGSAEDARLPLLQRVARSEHVVVGAHLEPYAGRTVASTAADIAYLHGLGILDLYVYRADDFTAAEWRPVISLVGEDSIVLAQTRLAGFAKDAGFDGIYTYDVLTYGAGSFARICNAAHALHLLCSPSVGPGFDARRATSDSRVLARRDGRTYDSMWRAALRSRADSVTITSYNEWHEGTQIEPARAKQGYESYAGAWEKKGRAARSAYLARTRYWTSTLGH
jgi:hypothetical protein